jgi:hypothetical protein
LLRGKKKKRNLGRRARLLRSFDKFNTSLSKELEKLTEDLTQASDLRAFYHEKLRSGSTYDALKVRWDAAEKRGLEDPEFEAHTKLLLDSGETQRRLIRKAALEKEWARVSSLVQGMAACDTSQEKQDFVVTTLRPLRNRVGTLPEHKVDVAVDPSRFSRVADVFFTKGNLLRGKDAVAMFREGTFTYRLHIDISNLNFISPFLPHTIPVEAAAAASTPMASSSDVNDQGA